MTDEEKHAILSSNRNLIFVVGGRILGNLLRNLAKKVKENGLEAIKKYSKFDSKFRDKTKFMVRFYRRSVKDKLRHYLFKWYKDDLTPLEMIKRKEQLKDSNEAHHQKYVQRAAHREKTRIDQRNINFNTSGSKQFKRIFEAYFLRNQRTYFSIWSDLT
jgi:hypothetical protein